MRRSSLVAALCLAAPAAPAGAAVPHTVAPGETLWSIAVANNLHTSALAAYNGVSPDHRVVLGSTVMIPSEAEALAAVNAAPAQPVAAPAATTTSTAAAPTATGTTTTTGTSGAPATTTATGTPAATASGPTPTPTRVTAADIQRVAAEHGVDGALAAAIAWQESGFNNAMASPANARGVMQVMPGTWDWIQRNLANAPLDPASATDNVRAGTLYLRQLLRETGGDPVTALAGYYQGLASVRRIGMLPETQRYVANVMALRDRFAGG